MRHTKVTKPPCQGGTDGQDGIWLRRIGGNVISLMEGQIARQRLCIVDDSIQSACLADTESNYHNQGNGHNDALQQIRCAGCQETTDAGIRNDDNSTQNHGNVIIHAKERLKQFAAGRESGCRIGDKENQKKEGKTCQY